jgi:phosphonate transport system substrate-binding protein
MIKKCTSRPHRWLIGGALAGTLWATVGQAQPLACSSRGQLGVAYCDADGDLVADTPLQTLNPDRLMVGITATEDAMTAKRTYGDFLNHLASCTKKEVLLFPPTREGDVIEAMRTGRVHIGQFATGATMFAVNHAGAVPFAGKGHAQTLRADGYQLLLIVRADSPFKHPKDLKGKKLAHTTVTSNSGNLAPRAIFPKFRADAWCGLSSGVFR